MINLRAGGPRNRGFNLGRFFSFPQISDRLSDLLSLNLISKCWQLSF